MTKIGKLKLKLRSGKIIKFKSEKSRDNYERVANAVRHGWKPKKIKNKKK